MGENEAVQLEQVKGFKESKTAGISPWMLSVLDELDGKQPKPRWNCKVGNFTFQLIEGKQSIWITAQYPAGGKLALRAAYCPDGDLEIAELNSKDHTIDVTINSTVGQYSVRVEIPHADLPLIRTTAALKPSTNLFIPFWPLDLLAMDDEAKLQELKGIVHAQQEGPRSGLVYFSLTQPKSGSAFYFQNLTSLNQYADSTRTSLAGVVGGTWPELGLALPPAQEKPLKAGEELTISDAYLLLSEEVPSDDLQMARQFLDMFSKIYLLLPPPETKYRHWPEILDKALHDLSETEKNWEEVEGQRYLNAYVGDYETPPESMVQLSVLLPLIEYEEWSGQEIPINKEILAGLPNFFDEKAGVYARWLPEAVDKLDGSEPHKKPRVMDSWYLYHSLLNLSRLAMRDYKPARDLFLKSMDYAIKVAHKFDYEWPIFYDLDTMEIIKAESEPGKGGETDVAGQYAHVMMQAWDLTKEDRYLEEAKRAAKSIQGLGFNLFYQANSTLFSSGAMLRLYNETKDELYLNLSYLVMANVFNQMWLWDCDYGFGKHYPTYFALFPLRKAPYTAVYEELEGFAAFHDYLSYKKEGLPDSLDILIAEFLRMMLYKAGFYYPTLLPDEMIADKPNTGEMNKDLWVPLEDLYDGWKQAGQVGQEVYGAGLPFGLVPRHYTHIPDENFMLYINYPTSKINTEEKGQITFHVRGSHLLKCEMRMIPKTDQPLPEFEVVIERDGQEKKLSARLTDEGHHKYEMHGNHQVTIRWKGGQSNNRKQ